LAGAFDLKESPAIGVSAGTDASAVQKISFSQDVIFGTIALRLLPAKTTVFSLIFLSLRDQGVKAGE